MIHLCGWTDHPDRHRLAAALPPLGLAAPHLMAGADGGDVFLYKAWKDVLGDYPHYPAQQIGDCTSFGSGHTLDLLQCVEISLGKQPLGYQETCTEAIYGLGREIAGMLGSGDGCYGAAVAKALTDLGAVPREAVGPYSGQRAKQWGARGVPAEIKQKAAAFRLGAAALITTCDEADAALANGYPYIVCSDQGFSLHRDQDGVCHPQGSWAHCMSVSGRRVKNGRRQYLINQSWGDQIPDGPRTDDQPLFTFWVDEGPMGSMLAARDSLAFSKFGGFEQRPLPSHWGWEDMMS